MRWLKLLLIPALLYGQVASAQSAIVRLLLSGGGGYPAGQTFAFDANVIGSLSTNIAGSTGVAADGDTVGTWRDLTANNFNLAAAADDTTRPIYHVSGGKAYVSFASASSTVLIRSASSGLWQNTNGYFTVCFSLRAPSIATNAVVLGEFATGSANSIIKFLTANSTTASSASVNYKTDSATVIQTPVGVVQANALDATWRVVCMINKGNGTQGNIDGVQGTYLTWSAGYSSAITTNRFTMGANMAAGSLSAYADMDISAARAWPRVLTPSELNRVLTLMKAAHP